MFRYDEGGKSGFGPVLGALFCFALALGLEALKSNPVGKNEW